jgi:hypothetical protein
LGRLQLIEYPLVLTPRRTFLRVELAILISRSGAVGCRTNGAWRRVRAWLRRSRYCWLRVGRRIALPRVSPVSAADRRGIAGGCCRLGRRGLLRGRDDSRSAHRQLRRRGLLRGRDDARSAHRQSRRRYLSAGRCTLCGARGQLTYGRHRRGNPRRVTLLRRLRFSHCPTLCGTEDRESGRRSQASHLRFSRDRRSLAREQKKAGAKTNDGDHGSDETDEDKVEQDAHCRPRSRDAAARRRVTAEVCGQPVSPSMSSALVDLVPIPAPQGGFASCRTPRGRSTH